MFVLVTGGTGFVGNQLVRRLIAEGHEVVATTWKDEPQNWPQVTYIDMETLLQDNLPRFDICYHQAAHNDTVSLERDLIFEANVHQPIQLFRNLRRAGCERFIYASSTAVYGDAEVPYTEETTPRPLNPYAESKFEFDRFASAFKQEYPECQIVGLRYCNVYGPGEERKGPRGSMIGQILRAAIEQKSIKLFRDGEQRRDWVNVQDVLRVNQLFGFSSRGRNVSGIFNVGTGQAHSFNEIVAIVNEFLEVKVEWVECPFPERYQSHTCCDITRLKEALHFEPHYNLRTGIESYVAELLHQRNV